MRDYFGAWGVVGLVVCVGVLLTGGALMANRALSPRHPTRDKLLTYECGVDPVGSGWAQMHVRYYLFAYLYVVFAVDAVYLFPWATVFAAPGYGVVTLAEMGVFVGVLAIGLLYSWRRGVLRWQ